MMEADAGAASPPELLDILVTGGTVITMDADFRVLERGAVALRGDRIVAVGPAHDLAARYEALRTIDAAGRIVMPGLVDAHAHAGHGLTKGLAEGRGGRYWLDLMEDLSHRAATPDFWYAEGLLSATERLKFGVTCGLSMPGSAPRVDDLGAAGEGVRAYEEVGLRYVLAIGPPDGPWPRRFVTWEGDTPVEREVTLEEALATSEAAIAAFDGRGGGRIRVSLGPSSIAPGYDPNAGRASDEARLQARELRRLADEYGAALHAHAYGGMIFQAARDYPELLGRDLSLAHCTGISPDEVRLLAYTGVSVVHGPYTHAYIAARCPVIELLEAGVNVAIGTDGNNASNYHDLMRATYLVAGLFKDARRDATMFPAEDAFAMATRNGARALQAEDELGSLEVGKQADLVLHDTNRPEWRPLHNVANQLVWSADGRGVHTVLVGGRAVVEDYRCTTVDEDDLLRRAQAAGEGVVARSGLPDRAKWPTH